MFIHEVAYPCNLPTRSHHFPQVCFNSGLPDSTTPPTICNSPGGLQHSKGWGKHLPTFDWDAEKFSDDTAAFLDIFHCCRVREFNSKIPRKGNCMKSTPFSGVKVHVDGHLKRGLICTGRTWVKNNCIMATGSQIYLLKRVLVFCCGVSKSIVPIVINTQPLFSRTFDFLTSTWKKLPLDLSEVQVSNLPRLQDILRRSGQETTQGAC